MNYFFSKPYVILFTPLLLGILFFGFVFVAEAQGLIPCGGSGQPACTFNHLIQLIQNIINFLIVSIAIPLAMILFAYAGWLYMSAGGDSGKISQGHQIFRNVIFGLVLALAAWLIINTLANVFLQKGVFDGYFFLQ